MLNLDHITLTVSNLNDAISYFEEMLNCSPILGGKHPNLGTHNALIGIGNKENKCFLELIAIDPNRNPEIKSFPFGLKEQTQNSFFIKIVEWCVNISSLRENIKNLSSIHPDFYWWAEESKLGSRVKHDGTTTVRWDVIRKEENITKENGTIPYVIDWLDSKHPSEELFDQGYCEQFSLKVYTPIKKLFERQFSNIIYDNKLEVFESNKKGLELILHNRSKSLSFLNISN